MTEPFVRANRLYDVETRTTTVAYWALASVEGPVITGSEAGDRE